MNRREFISIVGLSLLAAPLAAQARQAGIPRIGMLTGATPRSAPFIQAFEQRLRELSYVDGQTIAIEFLDAEGKVDRLPRLAAELVTHKVDIIVANANPAIQAALGATRVIPIVMVHPSDPVASGFVAGLARPGGNLTGLTMQSPELVGKRLQLLKEVAPNLIRVAILWDPSDPGGRDMLRDAEVVAPSLGLQLQLVEAPNPGELDKGFAAMTKAAAVFYPGSTMQFAHRARIAEHALKSRLPSMCGAREYVEAGCLLTYAASFTDLYRRAAYFVDKILKGAKPAGLPVEQPTKFELVINLKTAKALGLTIPQSVLVRADEIIQ